MTFSYFKLLLLYALPIFTMAQIERVVVQPSLSFSIKKDVRWSFNTTFQERNSVENGITALHVQAAQFVSYEIGFYSELGVGIMYRELFDQHLPEELRTTQQYVYSRKYNALKVAHRARWDQRWRDDRLTHRWRYRFSSSLPLNGSETDTKEFYVTASVETLFIGETGRKPALDQRFSAGLGRQMGKKTKLQFIIEYRTEDFRRDTERSLFIDLGLYYTFK
jgi:hypothetical protein